MEDYELEAVKRITTRPARDYRTLKVRSLTPIVGAEVSGLDLSKELTDDQLAEVKIAFTDHHVLVFRDQTITPAQHKRLATYFGEPQVVEPAEEQVGDPSVMAVQTTPAATAVAGDGWHADGTSSPEPSLGSMLYVKHVPEPGSGGDTCFANMHLAYDMLSPKMKSMLDGLTAVHDDHHAFRGLTPPPNYVMKTSEHPVVVRHPDTDREVLFVNPAYTSHIPQLSKDESRALLDFLCSLVPRRLMLSCRVRWEPNTLVFWDNRSVQHHALYDYYPHTRYGLRVAINGGPLKS